MTEISKPDTISRFKKMRFLLEMSEDQFRDEVIRPLFFRQGLTDGRDLCGPSEKGKDAVFVSIDKLGMDDVYVVQTKKGKLNLASKAQHNIVEAVTQLRTAAQTKVTFSNSRQKRLPVKVFLCASGTINEAARMHIAEEVDDPRIVFMDAEDLIPKIDSLFPELWLGIDANVAPYFRKLKQIIESSDDTLALSELLPRESQAGVATDAGFVMLQLYRMTTKVEKFRGEVKKVSNLEQLPVTGLLKKRKNALVVILGGAGSGKSTALKRLAYILATRGLKFDSNEKIIIPILLRANDIASHANLGLVEICDAETKKLTGLSTGNFSNEDLSAGRVFVLVDGLDELPNDDARISVLDLLDKFHVNYPLCPVVVTSRDNNNVENLSALKLYDTYRLSPINLKQAQQIIKSTRKGKGLSAEKSHELVRRLEEVHGMELNPLLVTVFAATSEYSRQDIPANITELFKKFTEMMLGRWDATKGFKQQYHGPLKDFILTKIAFEMHRDNLTSITSERFDHILRTELENRGYSADRAQLREEMLNRSGLFRTIADSIEFRHLMIQEFFAGRGIPSTEFLHSVVSDQWWRRAVVFYFGEHAENSDALSSTISAMHGKSVEQNYNAALTLGLALQACYLVEIKNKIDIYRWVVDSMAKAKDEFLTAGDGQYPITRFIAYYLFGRDSVALSVLEGRVDDIFNRLEDNDLSADENDIRRFWVIVGLIECGAITRAESLIKTFHPRDARLFFGLFLGAYFTQHVRITNKSERDSAKRICDSVSSKVQPLRTLLLQEMKSELLEVRQGNVKAVEAADTTEEEATDDPEESSAM
jgi:energy-coupling factor transporter ATP-binding protein EcfA2